MSKHHTIEALSLLRDLIEFALAMRGEVPRVHTEPESHPNSRCVKSAELLDIPTVQQAMKQTKRLGPVKRN